MLSCILIISLLGLPEVATVRIGAHIDESINDKHDTVDQLSSAPIVNRLSMC